MCQEEEEEACKAVPETEEADVSVNLRRGLGLGSVSCLLAQAGKTMDWNAQQLMRVARLLPSQETCAAGADFSCVAVSVYVSTDHSQAEPSTLHTS